MDVTSFSMMCGAIPKNIGAPRDIKEDLWGPFESQQIETFIVYKYNL